MSVINILNPSDKKILPQYLPETYLPQTSIWGSFISTTSRQVYGSNIPTHMGNIVVVESSGIDVSGLSDEQIVVSTAGVYKYSYSLQLDKSGGGTSPCDLWIRLNNQDVSNSASQVVVVGPAGETFPFCEYLLSLNAGDAITLMFASSDNSMTGTAFPLQTSPYNRPAIPSLIVNMYKIAG